MDRRHRESNCKNCYKDAEDPKNVSKRVDTGDNKSQPGNTPKIWE